MSRILIVDDEQTLLSAARKLLALEQATFSILTATSGAEAPHLIEEEQFDTFVSDYLIPGMDGLELLEILRDTRNTIPSIMFTGAGPRRSSHTAAKPKRGLLSQKK